MSLDKSACEPIMAIPVDGVVHTGTQQQEEQTDEASADDYHVLWQLVRSMANFFCFELNY